MWYYTEYTYIWSISTTHILWVTLGALQKIILWHSASPLNTFSDKKPTTSWASSSYLGIVITFRKSFLKTSTNLLLFSRSVMSDSLQPHGLQHARLPCPSLSPRVYSNSCPLSRWCHPVILSSVVPFSSCLQPFTASGSFPKSQFFTSDGQSTGASASASILPMNIQGWFPLGLTGVISLQLRDSQEYSPTPQFQSINSSVLSFLYSPNLTSIHDYWKNCSFDATELFWQSDVFAF